MRKYLERVERANKLKQEKRQLEEKVFNTGKNWTPALTQPSAPKITAKRTTQTQAEEIKDQLRQQLVQQTKDI